MISRILPLVAVLCVTGFYFHAINWPTTFLIVLGICALRSRGPLAGERGGGLAFQDEMEISDRFGTVQGILAKWPGSSRTTFRFGLDWDKIILDEAVREELWSLGRLCFSFVLQVDLDYASGRQDLSCAIVYSDSELPTSIPLIDGKNCEGAFSFEVPLLDVNGLPDSPGGARLAHSCRFAFDSERMCITYRDNKKEKTLVSLPSLKLVKAFANTDGFIAGASMAMPIDKNPMTKGLYDGSHICEYRYFPSESSYRSPDSASSSVDIGSAIHRFFTKDVRVDIRHVSQLGALSSVRSLNRDHSIDQGKLLEFVESKIRKAG